MSSVALVITSHPVIKIATGAITGLGAEQFVKCTVDLGAISSPAAAFAALQTRGFQLAGPVSTSIAPYEDNYKRPHALMYTTYTFVSSTPPQ
jgi:hypothetical protein